MEMDFVILTMVIQDFVNIIQILETVAKMLVLLTNVGRRNGKIYVKVCID